MLQRIRQSVGEVEVAASGISGQDRTDVDRLEQCRHGVRKARLVRARKAFARARQVERGQKRFRARCDHRTLFPLVGGVQRSSGNRRALLAEEPRSQPPERGALGPRQDGLIPDPLDGVAERDRRVPGLVRLRHRQGARLREQRDDVIDPVQQSAFGFGLDRLFGLLRRPDRRVGFLDDAVGDVPLAEGLPGLVENRGALRFGSPRPHRAQGLAERLPGGDQPLLHLRSPGVRRRLRSQAPLQGVGLVQDVRLEEDRAALEARVNNSRIKPLIATELVDTALEQPAPGFLQPDRRVRLQQQVVRPARHEAGAQRRRGSQDQRRAILVKGLDVGQEVRHHQRGLLRAVARESRVGESEAISPVRRFGRGDGEPESFLEPAGRYQPLDRRGRDVSGIGPRALPHQAGGVGPGPFVFRLHRRGVRLVGLRCRLRYRGRRLRCDSLLRHGVMLARLFDLGRSAGRGFRLGRRGRGFFLGQPVKFFVYRTVSNSQRLRRLRAANKAGYLIVESAHSDSQPLEIAGAAILPGLLNKRQQRFPLGVERSQQFGPRGYGLCRGAQFLEQGLESLEPFIVVPDRTERCDLFGERDPLSRPRRRLSHVRQRVLVQSEPTANPGSGAVKTVGKSDCSLAQCAAPVGQLGQAENRRVGLHNQVFPSIQIRLLIYSARVARASV